MLADLAAASPLPVPADTHSAYEWWSDIWLPAIVGLGSVAAAAAAVFVARRSNKFAAVSTRAAERATAAAERANELAAQALDHEREQASRNAEVTERQRRSDFADRVTARFDLFLEARERRVVDGPARHIPEIGTLALESIANGWDLNLNKWVTETIRLDPSELDQRRVYHSDISQAIHTTMAAWARDPDSYDWNRRFFKKKLNQAYPDSAP